MSGAFLDGDSPERIAARDSAETGEPGKVETGIKDVFADAEKQGMPVFNVSKDEFYQNMDYGRRRLRFKSGSGPQAYMQGTRYRNPFWIKYKDNGGKEYIRKVK